MKIKSQRDFASGLMFLAAGSVFAVRATHYAMGDSVKPGAGLFPLILAVLLAIVGAVVLLKSLTIETEGGDPIGTIAWLPLVAVVGAVALFGLAATWFGPFKLLAG
jgi:Tripartite tricarboxylate transporter TctB family